MRKADSRCGKQLSEVEKNRSANNGPHSVLMPFVGTDGIMIKTTTMDAVKTYPDLGGEGTVLAPSSPRRI